jgi:hypothetical protein
MSPHNHQIKAMLALALTVSAIAPTVAWGRVNLNPPAARSEASPQPAPQIVRVTDSTGFDWGDAGIGAAAGVGLSMFAIGGALVITQRRGHRLDRRAGA